MTKEKVEQMIDALGQLGTFGTKKEIGYLPEILQDDEVIKYLISGFLDGNTWLITCTSKRVIFLDKGMLFGLKQIEIPLNRINSIGQEEGLLFGEISIWDGASKMLVRNISKITIKPFVAALNKAIEDFKNKTNSNNNLTEDPIEKIKKLAELKEKGIISEKEFEDKKSELIRLI